MNTYNIYEHGNRIARIEATDAHTACTLSIQDPELARDDVNDYLSRVAVNVTDDTDNCRAF